MTYYVYCHTNKHNGKAYVGWSIDPVVRWNEHVKFALRGCGYSFHAAIRKYGVDDWYHDVLQVCETHGQVLEAEIFWIAYKGTFGDGYNLTRGGEGSLGWVPSRSTRAAISRSNKGQKRPRSVSHLAKLAARHNVQVMQMTIDGTCIATFASVKEASRVTGVNGNGICQCCRGRYKQAGGFVWRYVNEQPKSVTRNSKCLTDVQIAEARAMIAPGVSLRDIAATYGVSCHTLKKALNDSVSPV